MPSSNLVNVRIKETFYTTMFESVWKSFIKIWKRLKMFWSSDWSICLQLWTKKIWHFQVHVNGNTSADRILYMFFILLTICKRLSVMFYQYQPSWRNQEQALLPWKRKGCKTLGVLIASIKQGHTLKNWVEGLSDEAYYPLGVTKIIRLKSVNPIFASVENKISIHC